MRVAPYVVSWGVLAVLMIVGMRWTPMALYTPIDGEWAKWNVEATLQFGKFLDLGPYSMLAGMGSMYFPNLPWLNPGALALALPFSDQARSIISYAVYGFELALSIVLLARTIGFSWLTATAAAQLYLYLLFPPFSEVFHIYNWYSVAPYFAHLVAVLNCAMILLLACGRGRDRLQNASLAAGFLALFVIGLVSAPFTFIFATPAYVVICAVLIVARRPTRVEWGWKITALAACLMFFFASGLLNYYLGTIATVGRTPHDKIAWDQLLSLDAWLRLVRELPACEDPRLLLCIKDRGAWLHIAALFGAALAIVTRRGDVRTVAGTLVVYISVVHVYAYAHKAEWLGPASVLAHHFLVLSCWPFICMFAAFAIFESFRMLQLNAPPGARLSEYKRAQHLVWMIAVAVILVVIVVSLLRNPYEIHRYRLAQLLVGAAAFGTLLLAFTALRALRTGTASTIQGKDWQYIVTLAAFPILALVHLSIGFRSSVPIVRDPSLRNYLHENASIDVGKPFRGYTATVLTDKLGKLGDGPRRYISGRDHLIDRYGESFTETDLWRLNVPTFEEYGEWTSVQAHAFAARLFAPAGMKIYPNYLRAYTMDTDIFRALGIRYVLTDAETLDKPAVLRGVVSAPNTSSVHLFELSNVNLGTYSPTHFVNAANVDEIVQRIQENKDRLDHVAVVTDSVPTTNARARNASITMERGGIRIRAESDGPAHIVLPVQFSNCLVVINGAAVRLRRANLFQTLMSFDGSVDAKIEFHFGLFADNKCRLHDGLNNKALGL